MHDALDIHTTMADLIAGWPSAKAAIARRGMACVGCTMARFETIGEAAAAYGFDATAFIEEVHHAAAPVRSRTSRRGGGDARRGPGRPGPAHHRDRRRR